MRHAPATLPGFGRGGGRVTGELGSVVSEKGGQRERGGGACGGLLHAGREGHDCASPALQQRRGTRMARELKGW